MNCIYVQITPRILLDLVFIYLTPAKRKWVITAVFRRNLSPNDALKRQYDLTVAHRATKCLLWLHLIAENYVI